MAAVRKGLGGRRRRPSTARPSEEIPTAQRKNNVPHAPPPPPPPPPPSSSSRASLHPLRFPNIYPDRGRSRSPTGRTGTTCGLFARYSPSSTRLFGTTGLRTCCYAPNRACPWRRSGRPRGASSSTTSAPGRRRRRWGRRRRGTATAASVVPAPAEASGADAGPPDAATTAVGGGVIPIGIGATSIITGGTAVDVPGSTSVSFSTFCRGRLLSRSLRLCTVAFPRPILIRQLR